MICLRSQLSLKENISAADVWIAISEWRIHSKNTPKKIKRWLQEHPFENLPEKPIDENFGSITLSVYAANKTAFAFKLSEDEGKFITTICFNSEIHGSNFTLEMEVKNHDTYKFSRPKIFDYLKPLMPEDKYSKKAHKKGDYNSVAQFINGMNSELPVIYISTDRNNHYLTEPDKLAEELFGIAQIYKEPNNSFSKQLSKITNGKNPYNGTIGIFHNKNRIYISPDRIRNFDFFHRITQLSLLIQFNDNLTWYGMINPYLQQIAEEKQIKVSKIAKQIGAITIFSLLENVVKEIELSKSKEYQKKLEEELVEFKKNLEAKDELIKQLEEQLKAVRENKCSIEQELKKTKKEYEDYSSTFDRELEEKQKEIDVFKEKNEKLEAYKDAFAADHQKNTDITISIACPERALFPNEITDFIKGLIYAVAEKYRNYNGGSDKDRKGFLRLHDVLKSILENNSAFAFENSKAYKIRKELDRASSNSDKETLKILEDCGFEKDNASKEHSKMYFHGDKRYCVTLASTGGDKRGIKNDLARAKHFFLSPKDLGKLNF